MNLRNKPLQRAEDPVPERDADIGEKLGSRSFWEESMVGRNDNRVLGEGILQEVKRKPVGATVPY